MYYVRKSTPSPSQTAKPDVTGIPVVTGEDEKGDNINSNPNPIQEDPPTTIPTVLSTTEKVTPAPEQDDAIDNVQIITPTTATTVLSTTEKVTPAPEQNDAIDNVQIIPPNTATTTNRQTNGVSIQFF